MLFSLPSVLATDCDSGLNAELTYYTLSPDFSISPHGTVFPAGRLDYERPNHLYEFVVMAVDSGDEPHSGTATVRIRMANVNDEAPEFSQFVWAALLLPFSEYLFILSVYCCFLHRHFSVHFGHLLFILSFSAFHPRAKQPWFTIKKYI